MGSSKRGRGRPRREYRVRIRAERRATPDYAKLARALLEHAAMEQAAESSRDARSNSQPKPPSSKSTDDSEETPV